MDEGVRGVVDSVIHYLFPKDCFEELLVKFNLFHPVCSKLVLSRFLGLGIILGAVLVKVPQITKIWRGKSGVGVSLASQLLELTANTATLAYGVSHSFPFSSYGEAIFLAFQTGVIVLLILHYSGKNVEASVFTLGYGIILFCLLSGVVPRSVISLLQASNIPIIVVARLLQAYTNFRNKSTGQLSVVTVFLMFAGSLARIFTSMQETGDRLFTLTFIIASFMNGVIFSQILIYWGQEPKKKLL